mmetsp:Transcript_7184/g.22993  ORF Transcript_7184/g.22993 Transcript_7184/m.22993 type:complete len:204 (-) Transcript_7184:783-1394(-)
MLAVLRCGIDEYSLAAWSGRTNDAYVVDVAGSTLRAFFRDEERDRVSRGDPGVGAETAVVSMIVVERCTRSSLRRFMTTPHARQKRSSTLPRPRAIGSAPLSSASDVSSPPARAASSPSESVPPVSRGNVVASAVGANVGDGDGIVVLKLVGELVGVTDGDCVGAVGDGVGAGEYVPSPPQTEACSTKDGPLMGSPSATNSST